MFNRGLLFGLASLAFLVANTLGLHSHLSEDHEHFHDGGAHSHTAPAHPETHDVYLVSALSSDHAAEHVSHGDVDVDEDVAIVGERLVMATALVLSALCCLVLAPTLPLIRPVARLERPLRPPRRLHILPPSQAPPRSA